MKQLLALFFANIAWPKILLSYFARWITHRIVGIMDRKMKLSQTRTLKLDFSRELSKRILFHPLWPLFPCIRVGGCFMRPAEGSSSYFIEVTAPRGVGGKRSIWERPPPLLGQLSLRLSSFPSHLRSPFVTVDPVSSVDGYLGDYGLLIPFQPMNSFTIHDNLIELKKNFCRYHLFIIFLSL